MNITEGGNSNKKRAESSLEIWYKSWLNLELAKKPQTWNQPIFWYSGKNEEENKEKPEIHTQKNQLIKNNFAVYAAKKMDLNTPKIAQISMDGKKIAHRHHI